MTGYREPSPPPATRIELRSHDPKQLARNAGLWLGGSLGAILLFAVSATALHGSPLLTAACGALVAFGALAGLLLMIRRLWKLRFYLEISDTRVRLLLPNGDVIADTSNGSLAFTKVTYTRHGRHGSAWTRPGFRMRHAGGNHLVGILMPPAPLWPEGMTVLHDGGMPEFELRPTDFATLRARVADGA